MTFGTHDRLCVHLSPSPWAARRRAAAHSGEGRRERYANLEVTAKQAGCTLRVRQVAVVTGAASGIGLAMAESFAELGLYVVLADIDESHLSRAAALITDNGGSVLAVRTDVRSAEQVNDLAVATLDHFGRRRRRCQQRWRGRVGVHLEIEDSEWDWVLGVNLRGVIHGLRAFVHTSFRKTAATW